ncbi:MAG TPA: carboxypeptidase regulatory-like domain-containing protein [Longimicrobiales bacterium]
MLKRQRRWTQGAVVFVATFALACGSGAPADEEQASAEAGAAAMAPPVDPATAATITGRVVFEGAPPAMDPIDMSEEPTCAGKHPNGAFTEQVVVNDNGTLRNVFVYVKEGLGDRAFPTPSEPVVLDQVGCVYHPHVLGVQVGQALVIRNSDGLLHNINARPSMNRPFNVSQPTTMETTRTFGAAEVMVPVACDVHGWMQAYIGVVEHPYFGTTGDDGTFSLAQLPPGDYVVEAWHERYGTQTMNVTVAANETKEIEFRFSAAMAAHAVVPLGEPIDPHDHAAGARGAASTAGTASGAR